MCARRGVGLLYVLIWEGLISCRSPRTPLENSSRLSSLV